MASRKPAATSTAQVEAAFRTLAAQSGFKRGDTVKILRPFTTNELGCGVEWNDDMASEVGKEVRITDDYAHGEWELDHGWNWPFHVLQKLAESNLVELEGCDYTAEISADGKTVEVGCQSIEAASILALADRIREAQAAHAAKNPPKPATATRSRSTRTRRR